MAKRNKFESMVASVSAQLPEVTEEHVRMVLETVDRLSEGRPVGTVLIEPGTGNVAVRVSRNGIEQWQVTAADGGTWADLQPDLDGWEPAGGK